MREHVDIPRHKLRVLMHALCATHLVEKEQGRYANSTVADALLASSGPDAWRHILLGWQKIYYPAFAHTTAALSSGTNTALAAFSGSEPTLYQRLAHDPEAESTLHASMGAFTLQSMSGLLDNADLTATRHLLDVGGGDGTTAHALAARHPHLRVTTFDMESVTRISERYGADDSAAARVASHAGDLFDDAWPSDVDGVLFSHVLEVFSAEQILTLLAKALAVLPPGGRIFIYGFNATDDEREGLLSARLSLYLNVLASGQGMAYPGTDYERWLRQVGAVDVTSTGDLPYEHGLTVGTRPARP